MNNSLEIDSVSLQCGLIKLELFQVYWYQKETYNHVCIPQCFKNTFKKPSGVWFFVFFLQEYGVFFHKNMLQWVEQEFGVWQTRNKILTATSQIHPFRKIHP